MRIQNNIAAVNAHRVMGSNSTNTSKSLEKLSSGFRINRAGDDAAGLAISEKMRAQIKGLETASKNANDGISLIQTAEGSLTEVHSMLNRMTELATQSANGTYDDGVDRGNLQKEIESLTSEIDRISDSTNYNGIKLLDGSLSQKSAQETRRANGQMEVFTKSTATAVTVASQDATKSISTFNVGSVSADMDNSVAITFTASDGKSYNFTLADGGVTGDLDAANIVGTLNGTVSDELAFGNDDATKLAMEKFKETFTASVDGTNVKIESKTAGKDAGSVTGIVVGAQTAATDVFVTTAGKTQKAADKGYTVEIATAGNVEAGNIVLGDKTIALVEDETLADTLGKINAEGFNAVIDPNDATKILITDIDKLKVAQKGTGVNTTSDTAKLSSKEAEASKYETTLAATSVSANKEITLKYTDVDGVSKEKTLDYNTGADATASAANMAAAINADEELKDLFSVTSAAGKLTLEAKMEGAGKASVQGLATTDATATQAIVATEGKDKGTEIGFGKDKFGAAGAFKAGDKVDVNGKTYQFVDNSVTLEKGATGIKIGDDLEESLDALKVALKKDGIESEVNSTNTAIRIADTAADVKDTKGGLTLQVGADSESFQQVKISVENMGTKNLGLDKINIATQEGANDAIDKIKSAINTVSGTRGDLGAIQNRLEHTISNLNVSQENMVAAESRIRDVDMAKEMMNFTKNNILVQASQAMLAQANQQPQGVLQLLR